MLKHYLNPLTPALFIALTALLSACEKPEESQVAAIAASAAKEAFPMGNGTSPLTPADCEKIPNPKPTDDSAASQATAVSQGTAARAACKKAALGSVDKPNADLARIREIKEKEQADEANRKISEKEWGKRLNEGAGKPIKDYKY